VAPIPQGLAALACVGVGLLAVMRTTTGAQATVVYVLTLAVTVTFTVVVSKRVRGRRARFVSLALSIVGMLLAPVFFAAAALSATAWTDEPNGGRPDYAVLLVVIGVLWISVPFALSFRDGPPSRESRENWLRP
jgi:hypothetical protein